MKSYIIPILLIYSSMYGCGTNGQQTMKAFNKLRDEVKYNYTHDKKTFDDLKSCFNFRYVKAIEFKTNQEVLIDYKMNDSSEWEKIVINMNDGEATGLKEDGMSLDYLVDLGKKLRSINANSILIQDDYDVTKGFDFKVLDIKYLKKVNDLYFVYRIYERPLDSIEAFHYSSLADNKGGVLDKDVIYYYK